MKNEQIIFPHFLELYHKIIDKDFVEINGTQLVEIIGLKMELDPSQPFLDFGSRKTPLAYAQQEIKWYESQDLNIKGHVDDVSVWREVADRDGFINSNYGWCIYSKDNGDQYNKVFDDLMKDPTSRKATMIYNRPSMHTDWNRNGRRDFMCTMYHHFFIRQKQLQSIYSMRSNDAIYGFFNDFYWACNVHNKLYFDLNRLKPELQLSTEGKLIWFADSWHLYSRHFDLLKQVVENYKGE